MPTKIISEFFAMSERQGVKTTQLPHEVEQLKKHVMKLEEKITIVMRDDYHNYNDSHNITPQRTLVLSGSVILPASNMKSCSEIVCKLVKNSQKVNISTSDISVDIV